MNFNSDKEFSILIIEDNEEMRQLINDFLESEYHTLQAENGKIGFSMAQEHIPDLILTDVAMPDTDGLAFCTQLRKTFETAHIPVVMITAKAMEDDQVKGYESGATDYIIKPFNVAILKLKIKNILESIKNLRSRFSIEKNNFTEITNNRFDKELMEKFMNYLSLNYQESTLNLDEIAIELGMSKSTLYRKLKAITGSSAIDLLQLYRLQKAYTLLANTDFNVSEVAYMVGYSDPGYFSTRFKDHFQIAPSSITKSGI